MSRKSLKKGIFSQEALGLSRRGLVVLPTGGEDGKKPLIKEWGRQKSESTITDWVQKFPDSNIGVAVGASGYVVVDVDHADGDPVDLTFRLFGPTPLSMTTPRGGLHFWYGKEGPVPSGPFEIGRLKGDIKADGGQVIVPPSCHPITGKSYGFAIGSWDDLAQLPPFKDPRPLQRPPPRKSKSPEPASVQHSQSNMKIQEGARNKTLFHRALGFAAGAATLEEFDARLRSENQENMDPPLPDDEVTRIRDSVRNYKEKGTLRLPGQGYVQVSDAELTLLDRRYGDQALTLLTVLRRNHGVRKEPFAIAAEKMAEAQLIAGWGPKTYTRARNILIKEGWLIRVAPSRRDRRGNRTPAQYRLTEPSAKSADNTTYTPPRLLPASTGRNDGNTTVSDPRWVAGRPESKCSLLDTISRLSECHRQSLACFAAAIS